MKWFVTTCAPIVLASSLIGCSAVEEGDGIDRQSVSGVVNFDGKPLDSGSIQFIPAANPGSAGGASGVIKEGRYELPKGRGPAAGSYNVLISSVEPDPIAGDEAPGPPPKAKPDRIPKKYNTATTLSIEIKAGEPNVRDFELAAK